MSSNSYADALELRLRPSARMHRLLLVLHAVALALLPFSMRGGLPMLAVAALIAASWLWLRRHPALGFGPRALSRLIWHRDARWTIETATGTAFEAELMDSSRIGAPLQVLHFRCADGRRRSRALLGDELPPELRRRLRMRLSSSG